MYSINWQCELCGYDENPQEISCCDICGFVSEQDTTIAQYLDHLGIKQKEEQI